MVYDIIIGRSEEDRKKFGLRGTVFIGKQYVKMGRTTSMSNPIYLDVAVSHVMLICGKRGSGKSYTMGTVAEGIADLEPEVKQNLSIILLDTMGVYWTMKYPNYKDQELLDQWGLKSKGLDIKIYTPYFYYEQYKEQGIPTDYPFSVKPSEFSAFDWCMTFEISENSELGVLITKIIGDLNMAGREYSIDDIIRELKNDKDSDKITIAAAVNHFKSAETWGLFSKEGTPIKEIAKGGQVSVIDASCYATIPNGWQVKSLLIGLIAKKMFIERMIARKQEEYEEVTQRTHFFGAPLRKEKKDIPLVWLVIDEAHEFLPSEGKTVATDPLIAILREGRQPGISLILATQQPGKIHTDVMTQADIVLSHRITAKLDVDALGLLMQSYMREGLTQQLDALPRVNGAGILFDDTNERLYPIQIRPRFTWHGGAAPEAIHEEKKVF